VLFEDRGFLQLSCKFVMWYGPGSGAACSDGYSFI
jgi:hypothetical protein